jgi:hypothetical protein
VARSHRSVQTPPRMNSKKKFPQQKLRPDKNLCSVTAKTG